MTKKNPGALRRKSLYAALLVGTALVRLSQPGYAQSQQFLPAGPGVEIGPFQIMNGADLPALGQPTNVPPQFATQSGAIQALAFDPFNTNVLLAASPNGGIFRSTNAGSSWTATTDNQGSLSIASLNFDPTDISGNTVIAGVGITSSGATFGFNPYFNRSRGGVLDGLLISSNAGATWTNLGANLPAISIEDVSIRGSVVLAGAFNEEGSWQFGGGVEAGSGLYRSTDGGHTFAAVSSLPAGAASALVGDPANPNRLYVAITTAAAGNANDAGTSVWTTTDGGATWSKVFDATNASGTINASDPTMLRLAAGPNGSVAVAVVDGFSGTVTGLFLSKDRGTTWHDLSIALTPGSPNGTGQADPGSGVSNRVHMDGLTSLDTYFHTQSANGRLENLSVNPGGQASIHSVVSVDPNNPNIVYLAGDRQDLPSPTGAVTFSGNALSAALNADNTVTYAAITDNFTADHSTYHPDTRAMAFTPSGSLLVGSDGGVYSRTSPSTSTGVWRGLNIGRQALEIYDLSLDPHSGLLAVAAQDNGTAIQSPTNPLIYREVAGGDGTVAPVNGVTDPNSSWTYVACQYLCGGPTRIQTDLHGNFTNTTPVDVFYSVDGTAAGIIGIDSSNVIFVPKLKLNNIDPSYQALGVQPGIIVARDNVLTPGILYATNPILGFSGPGAYTILTLNFAGFTGFNQSLDFGTRDNEWALLAGGSSLGGHRLFVSTATSFANLFESLTPVSSYTGFAPTAVLFDPRSQNRFFATDTNVLYGTVDGGATGTNLAPGLPADFIRPQSLAFISSNGVNELLVGGLNDTANVGSPLVIADSDASGNLSGWRRFGIGLPNSIVTVLDYVPSLDELAVGTFGRGAFALYDVTSNFANATVLQFGLANNNSTPDTSLLTDGTVGSRPLIKYGTGTLTITGNATYTGGTTIDAGTMVLGTGGASGSIIGNVAFCSGGSLCDTSTNKTLAFNRSDLFTFAGVISGPGQLQQVGSGTTTLTGTSTYTGPTLVSGGTLKVNGSLTSAVTVNSGASLAGIGRVGSTTINSGGTLSPGDAIGTLTVNGNLTLAGGSAFVIDANGSGAGNVAASGTVSLNGTALYTPIGGFVPRFGQTNVIATGSSITGAFSSVPNTLTGVLHPVVTVGPTNVILSIQASSLAGQLVNPTPDQSTIAGLLDQDRATHYNDLAPIYNEIDLLGDGPLAAALSTFAPQATRAIPTSSQTQVESFTGLLWGQLAGFQSSGAGGDQTGFHIATSGLRLAMNSFNSIQSQGLLALGLNAGQAVASDASPAAATTGTGDSWFNLGNGAGGFLNGSSLNGSVSIGGGAGGKATLDGYIVAAGLEANASDTWRVGVALSLAQANTSLLASPSKTHSNSIQGAVYFSHAMGDGFSLDGFVGDSGQAISTNRIVVVGATPFTLNGHTSGNSPTVGVGLSERYDLNAYTLIPAVSLQYLNTSVDAYTESGGVPAMTFSSFSQDHVELRVGADGYTSVDLGDTNVRPMAHFFFVHDFEGSSPFTAGFAAAPGVLASFVTGPRTQSWVEVGTGADVDVRDNVTLGLHYDATVGRNDLYYGAVTGKVRITW